MSMTTWYCHLVLFIFEIPDLILLFVMRLDYLSPKHKRNRNKRIGVNITLHTAILIPQTLIQHDFGMAFPWVYLAYLFMYIFLKSHFYSKYNNR